MVSCAPVGNRRLLACLQKFRRVTNPPQVANLPHNFRRIPVRWETKWHWALMPAPAALLRGCHIAEALQRGMASAQLPQLLFAQLFGAACHDPHSALDEYPAESRIGRRGGDVTEGAQQPQADGHVRLRIHADLV